MKKTAYMVLGSLLLFFILAFMDEYEKLILPLFKEEVKALNVEAGSDFSEKNLSRFLEKFNEQLSVAYAASNPGKAWELPAGGELQRSVHDELVANLSNNVTVKSKVESLIILRIDPLSKTSAKVIALETITRGENKSRQEVIAYTIEKREKGLLVTAMEYVEAAQPGRETVR